MIWLFLVFVLWMIVLVSLTFFYWLRPASFFGSSVSAEELTHSVRKQVAIGTVLAILLFVSCYLMGAWLAFLEYKGWLWTSLL